MSFPRRRKPLAKTEQECQEFEAVPLELANAATASTRLHSGLPGGDHYDAHRSGRFW
jgi:hypothetical protein